MSVNCSAGCGCADCTAIATSRPFDPPAFRAPALFERMRQRVHGWQDPDGGRPLAQLATADPTDPAIALVAAWAGALHVIGWNAARLADDAAVTRSTDPLALAALTALVGYRPRPALAATTTLAFTLEELPGAPETVTVPAGTRVASVPLEGGQPVIFETDAPLVAERAWNALRPAPVPDSPAIGAATAEITLAGAGTPARAGDLVLVAANPAATGKEWLLARISGVTHDAAADPPRTRLALSEGSLVAAPAALAGTAFAGSVRILGARSAAFGANAPDLALMSPAVIAAQAVPPPSGTTSSPTPTEWKDLRMLPGKGTDSASVDLDAISADAAAGRACLLAAPGIGPRLGLITAVAETARVGFALSAKVTRITFTSEGNTGIDSFADRVRATTIWIETAAEKLLVPALVEPLPRASEPDRLRLSGLVSLPEGRVVILQGPAATGGGMASERAVVRETLPDPAAGTTLLVLAAPLAGQFRSDGLVILGNCAPASQGESQPGGDEILGSGDAAILAPRFALRNGPVAELPAPGPRGHAPAIALRVDERLYTHAETLWSLAPGARSFTLGAGPDGQPEVQVNGRLPSGSHNVTARYRVGGGARGNLAAGRLTTIMTPLPGLRAATNPQAAEGGSDAEGAEATRRAAPKGVRILGRVVAAPDYAAFAEAYRGIGKAHASELRQGMRRVLCLTVATSDLRPPVAGSALVADLRAALADVSPPDRVLRIEGFDDIFAVIGLALATDPALPRARVEAAVRDALALRFGKAARGFAEGIHRSQVLAVAAAVPGVVAARITAFATSPAGPAEDAGRLLCPAPRFAGGSFRRAGLLSVDPALISFSEMQP